jgi:hypothetical protein
MLASPPLSGEMPSNNAGADEPPIAIAKWAKFEAKMLQVYRAFGNDEH